MVIILFQYKNNELFYIYTIIFVKVINNFIKVVNNFVNKSY